MRILFFVFLYLTAPLVFSQPNVELINYTTSISVVNNRLETEESYLIQVNKPQGDHVGEISLLYQDGDKLDIVEAYILDENGDKVRKVKKKEVITRSNFSASTFHEDNMVKEFTLKWHQYPYQIYYRYKTITHPFLYIAHWIPYIQPNIPTRNAVLKVEVPGDYEVLTNVNGEYEFKKDEIDDAYLYSWHAKNLAAVTKEKLSPPLYELLPKIAVIPKNFTYGTPGSFESWASFGEWQENLIHNLDVLPQREKNKVDELLQGIDDKKEIIKVLYNYMQDNTRYINVAIDIGGLKPYPASYVSDNKYGDCKALTIYMKALLKYAGVNSYYTIIHAGDSPVKIDTSFPGQQFNHVILNAPLANDTVWLENTANYLPVNYLGTFTQNRYALVVDGQNSRLIKTPALHMDQVVVKNIFEIKLNEQGDGEVNISRTLRGDDFDSYKYYQHNYKKEELTPLITGYLNFTDYELINYDLVYPDRDKPEMNVVINLIVKDQLKEYGSTLALKPVGFSTIELEKPGLRKHVLRIPFPRNQIDSLTYDLTNFQNYELELPEEINIQNKYFIYKETYELRENKLVIKRHFLLPAGEYSVKDYASFYAAMKEIDEANRKSVITLNPRQ
ncbi:MAG: DUF3857 domain-containing protein [Candidatus Cyclobacteriaceae bacterium M2_1C_046]